MLYRLLPLAALIVAACATTEDQALDGARPASAPARTNTTASGPMRLVRDAPEVRTVQLYAGADERTLPVLALGSNDPLTLEFDLLTGDARPLSLYVQHADRAWRRDLIPIQFIQGFERADVLTYERSRLGATHYVHYRQAVPGQGARLLVSGNYVARVTELGNPDAVLFERPFFVAETGTPVQAGLSDAPGAGIGPGLLPLVRVSTRGLDPAPFGYTACFVMAGRFEAPRCSERPYTVQPDAVTFTLPLQNAFRPDAATFYADLREWRVTPRVPRVDVRTDTTQVTLAPDDATFPDLNTPDLVGQTVVREGARTAGDPALVGEYAWVTFTFVPPNEIMLRDAYLEGSFSGWMPRATPLTWVPEARHYRGRVLLKQGRYEYRYTSSDPRLSRAQSGVLGRSEASLTTLVYYRDMTANTDRLLAAPTQRVRP